MQISFCCPVDGAPCTKESSALPEFYLGLLRLWRHRIGQLLQLVNGHCVVHSRIVASILIGNRYLQLYILS